MNANMFPSKVATEYRVHYGTKPIENTEYFEIEVPIDEMDRAWSIAVSLVKSNQANKVSISTKMAHIYFDMKMAVIAVHPSDNLTTEEFESLLYMVFVYNITRKKVVFN